MWWTWVSGFLGSVCDCFKKWTYNWTFGWPRICRSERGSQSPPIIKQSLNNHSQSGTRYNQSCIVIHSGLTRRQKSEIRNWNFHYEDHEYLIPGWFIILNSINLFFMSIFQSGMKIQSFQWMQHCSSEIICNSFVFW